MTKEITAADLIREVRIVASERPDFTYVDQPDNDGSCSYFGQSTDDHSGEPCIIGQAFKRLGYEPEGLRQAELSDGVNPNISMVIRDYGIPASTPEAVWLGLAQRMQDRGSDWGTAVAAAEEEMRYRGIEGTI